MAKKGWTKGFAGRYVYYRQWTRFVKVDWKHPVKSWRACKSEFPKEAQFVKYRLHRENKKWFVEVTAFEKIPQEFWS